jgi:hypothetical protein
MAVATAVAFAAMFCTGAARADDDPYVYCMLPGDDNPVWQKRDICARMKGREKPNNEPKFERRKANPKDVWDKDKAGLSRLYWAWCINQSFQGDCDCYAKEVSAVLTVDQYRSYLQAIGAGEGVPTSEKIISPSHALAFIVPAKKVDAAIRQCE